MISRLLTRRWLTFLALATVFAVACVFLGRWQWGRYEEKSAKAHAVTANYERSPVPLRTFAEVGWAAHGFSAATREAAAFALLGYCRAQGWANTLPHTTGAREAVCAGKWTPAPLSARPQHPHPQPPEN